MQPENFNEWYGPKPATRAQVAAFVRDNRIRYDASATGTRCGILGCGLVHPSVGAVSANGKQPCALFIDGKYVPTCVYCTAHLTDPHVQARAEAAEKKYAALRASRFF